MQTATLYTLQSKVIPVYDDKTLRYLDRSEDVTPLYIEGGSPVFTPSPIKETILPLHHVCKSFRVSRGCSEIRPPEPWKLYDSEKDWKTGDDINTYHHLFAVEPELERILWHVFNEEKVAGKISKLEHEKKVETGKLEMCLEILTQTRQEKSKLGEKLNDALNTNASLNERLLSAEGELFVIRRRVHKYCQYNVFRRLWVAFRNDLTP
jgi:hypothetical protein